MRFLLAVLLLLCPPEALAAAGYTFAKIARVGDPAPGTGETFSSLGIDGIHDASGRVYFRATFGSPARVGVFSWAIPCPVCRARTS